MKTSIFTFALLISVQIFGQVQSETDFISEIKNYDISHLLILEDFLIEDSTFMIVRPQPLGFIGNNFQRFYIRFISVIKNPSNPIEYLVYGKTKVKNNICSFQGKLTLKKSKIYDAPEHSTRTSGNRFLSSKHSPQKQGIVTGEYEFYGDPNQKGAGVFKGEFVSRFFLPKENELEYDVLMWNADGYENNQFKGIWESYITNSSKVCNWGDYRIPNCGDLDVGTENFIPDDKYNDFGWSNYRLSLRDSPDESGVLEARGQENKKWWLD